MTFRACNLTVFCMALLCVLVSNPALSAEPAQHLVQPLGEFARVRNTGDHTYGHRVRLRRSGGQLIGEIVYWDGNLEGQRAHFIDGSYDQRTGAVRFSTIVIRSDVQPTIKSPASFVGVVNKGALSGKLAWSGEHAQFRGRNGVEDVVLPLQKDERLSAYQDIRAWQTTEGKSALCHCACMLRQHMRYSTLFARANSSSYCLAYSSSNFSCSSPRCLRIWCWAALSAMGIVVRRIPIRVSM